MVYQIVGQLGMQFNGSRDFKSIKYGTETLWPFFATHIRCLRRRRCGSFFIFLFDFFQKRHDKGCGVLWVDASNDTYFLVISVNTSLRCYDNVSSRLVRSRFLHCCCCWISGIHQNIILAKQLLVFWILCRTAVNAVYSNPHKSFP